MKLLFFFSTITLAFIYVFYGIIIRLLNQLSKNKKQDQNLNFELPEVAFLITAYNEEEVIREKLINTLSLNYPADKLKVYVNSDGSDDKTNTIVSQFEKVKLLWKSERKGKTAAINRALPLIEEPIVIFSDANVMLNSEAILEMVKHYAQKNVGGVSGEKRVIANNLSSASGTEGLYWKYESFLKREDAKLKTLIGAAGELFSIRSNLFIPLPEDTILDDFMISMNIIKQGYRIAYEPEAYAKETPSLNISEEYKRKVRIGAGGLQSVLRLGIFLNPFSNFTIMFQYFFHRFSRWILSPILIPLAFISNLFLIEVNNLYLWIFIAQLIFHLSALLGWYFDRKKIHYKVFFIPFYFNFMHYCILAGWIKFLSGNQKVTWQKATRLAIS